MKLSPRAKRLPFTPIVKKDGESKLMDINDGMVFEVRFNTIIVHCKIIVSHIISYDVFINGCNLIYLYDVSSGLLNLNDLHTFNNLIGIKIVDLAQCNLEAIKFVGRDPINTWEVNMDIGIKSINQGKWIDTHDISGLKHNHEIVKLGDKILAIPFYDMKNEQLNHIPLFQIEEGVTTVSGLLREIKTL